MIKKTLQRFISPIDSEALLRITFLSGVMLFLLLGAGLIGIIAGAGGTVPRRAEPERESPFHRLLREYDFKYRQIAEIESQAVQRQEFERLDNDLDRLEERAEGVESWLSVLKRRRQLAVRAGELARTDSRYMQAYRQSAQRAALAFPFSEQIAVVAAAALIQDAAITREAEVQLRTILPLLASPRLFPMRLSLHVLMGDFRSPERAIERMLPITRLPPDTSLIPGFAAPEAQSIAANLTTLRILTGNPFTAAADIQAVLFAFPTPSITRLAAEYHYDFGNLLRSAELFSLLPDEESQGRQADALWLADYTDSARTIWTMLTASPNPVLQGNAFYNLALTAHTDEEEMVILERLLRQANTGELSRQYGLIRYSRFFEAPQAIAILDTEQNPSLLIDLETLRRQTEIREVPRIIADTWITLDRYPGSEELYQWGAWYFALQRNYTEIAMLLRNAARQGFSGQWMQLHEALQQIHKGNVDAAEDILWAIPAQDAHWTVAANLGRILETRRAPARALESYEIALIGVMEEGLLDMASRIQVRIAHCLKALGRTDASRRALEYALDLNPDNLNARLELYRLQ
jgi:tetratricopeptide (TPR) repeat protein